VVPPATLTLTQNTTLTLSVTVKPLGAGAATYQWSRSTDSSATTFTNIPGATSRIFTKTAEYPADNQITFRVTVSLPAGLNPTASTLLTVIPDTFPPTLVSAGSVDGLSIGICFSEKINFNFGQPSIDPAYYQINDGTP